MTQTFDTPTRQSSVAILFILGKVFRALFRQLWVFILVFFFNPKKQVFNSFTMFIIGMGAFGAITSVISYFRLYYYIENGELVLEKGVLRKKKINVPLDRIQTVNFRQGVLHQFFNVVSVEIDTAGSTGKEFSLDALKKEDAEALREVVERSRQAVAGSPQSTGGSHELGVTSHQSPITNHHQLLFTLSPIDLLKIGISQNHFRTAGVIMVFFLSFFDEVSDVLDFDLTEQIEKWLGMTNEAEVIHLLIIGVPFFFLVSFFITLFRTVLQYFGLKFWQTDQGFKMESGLFTRQEVSANLNKVQLIRWDDSPLMRFFRMFTVRLPQAASVQVTRKLSSNVPGCYPEHLDAIRAAYFPEEKSLPETSHGVHWRIIYRMFVLQGLLPVAVLMAFSWSWLQSGIWIWLCWLPVALWLSWRYQRNWQWQVSSEGIRTNWGVLNRHSVLLQWYKVQAVSIRQSIFMKRRGLANLILYTAAGSVSVPYIPIEKARQVQDYVLYRVEKDKRSWM